MSCTREGSPDSVIDRADYVIQSGTKLLPKVQTIMIDGNASRMSGDELFVPLGKYRLELASRSNYANGTSTWLWRRSRIMDTYDTVAGPGHSKTYSLILASSLGENV